MENQSAKRTLPNPYHPPAILPEGDEAMLRKDASTLLSSVQETLADHPIEFRGQLDREDLDRYLMIDGDLGIAFPVTMIGFVGVVMAVLVGVGGPRFAPLCLCLVTFVVIGLMVSSRAYRRSLFVGSYEDWDQPVSGRLTTDGLTIERENVITRYAFDSWTMVATDNQLIAIEAGFPSDQTVLVTPSMIPSLDDWTRFRSVAEQMRRLRIADSVMGRASSMRSTLRSASRNRGLQVPVGAIEFAGPLSTSDLATVPSKTRAKRPLRARVVRLSLLFLLVGTFFEAVRLILPNASTWFVILTAYLIATATWFYTLGRRAIRKSRPIHHTMGFINDRGITSDFGIIVTEVPWRMIRAIRIDDDRMTLVRRGSYQLLHLRADMFQSDDQWEHVKAMAKQRSSQE